MQELVNQCLNLIVKDDVDQVVQAFRDTYFRYINKNFPAQESNQGVLDRFLGGISRALGQREYKRRIISEKEMAMLSFRPSLLIANVIQQFLTRLEKHDRINFLGELVGAYALVVPEPLFRIAQNYLGLHMTPNIPAIDDNLPMTDEMILYAWQYDWFHSWLGE